MKISINNKRTEIKSGMTLEELVDSSQYNHEKGIAVALNGEVIAKTKWLQTIVNENDRLMFFAAIPGG